MACFTAEHVLSQTERNLYSSCCRIDDDIWVLQWFANHPMEMQKFDLNTTQWKKVTIANGDFVRHEVGVHFIATSWNGNILLARRKKAPTSEIFLFNTVTLEWQYLTDLPTGAIDSRLFIVDNTLYTVFGRVHLAMICMDRFDYTTVEWPAFENGDSQLNNAVRVLEMNGLIYAIKLRTTDGLRSVYQYDKHNRKFVDIHEERRSHIARSPAKRPYSDWSWSCNNKIYHAFLYVIEENFLIIDSFDIGAKQWQTVIKSRFFGNIIGLYSTDNMIHIVSDGITRIAIRDVDQLPTLETLSLVRTSKCFVDVWKKDQRRKWSFTLPYCLRNRFKNVALFMMRDVRVARQKNHKNTDQEEYEQLGI